MKWISLDDFSSLNGSPAYVINFWVDVVRGGNFDIESINNYLQENNIEAYVYQLYGLERILVFNTDESFIAFKLRYA